MSNIRRDYLLTVNKFREPEVLTDKEAVGSLLTRLLVLTPGTDPLHPDMGVGIIRYRYGVDNKSELKKKIEEQISTYLPYFVDSSVSLSYTEDHCLVVSIQIADVVYTIDTTEESLPVGLEDIANN